MGIDRVLPVRELDCILAIDPSSTKLGWARFGRVGPGRNKWKLGESGMLGLPSSSSLGWVAKLDRMVLAVENQLVPDVLCGRGGCVIEMPQVFGGGRGDGRAAAALNSGDLLKLAGLVLALREMMLRKGLMVQLVAVAEWKGQVPKMVTQRRVREHWAWSGSDHNEADAVGIGDYLIRKAAGCIAVR